MEMAYYSGSKEKDRFKCCIDILIRTETKIKKYDILEDTLYISYNRSAISTEGALEVEKAFQKAGYLDIKVKYVGGGTSWTGMYDAENYYRDQYNKVLKEECLEPLVMTFLNQYLDVYVEKRVIEDMSVDQVRENLNEACRYFKINGWSEKESLYSLILAVLHAAGFVDDRIIRRFIFAKQSREIVDSISVWLSGGYKNELVDKMVLKLSNDEHIKFYDVIEWEMRYMRTNFPDKDNNFLKMDGIICKFKSSKKH